jgi:ERCC4-type nuclease
MTLLFDNRERALIALYDPPPATAVCEVGDIWIGDPAKPGSICAERKTIADFEASILDGRYREQRTRMTAAAAATGARPLYILEGLFSNGGTGRLTPAALMKHMTRLTIRYGIPVIQTVNLRDTKVIVDLIAEQMAADPDVFVKTDPTAVAYTTTICSKKRENRDDPAVFASAVLQQCPGVSAKIADALVAEFKTLAAVWAATETELMAVKIGARKIGPVVAQRLLRLLHG